MSTSDRQSVSGRNRLSVCHPERSLAIREANRQTKSKDPYEFVLPEKNWLDIIGAEFDQLYMTELKQFLQQEEDNGHTIYPKREEIFTALNLTPFKKIKVVIIGQDPYHGEGQANGLCFSVRKDIEKIPPSLKNIHKECGIDKPSHGDLTGWAEQGVLLLNATLTVRKHKAGSHRRKGKGWEKFTDAVIRAVNDKQKHVVFLLWGRRAQEKRALIDPKKHKVLKAFHPSGLSAYRGFLGCGHFRKTNAYLKKHGRKRIEWQKIGPPLQHLYSE
jgi:uracil-DNA glycosylase